MKSRLFLATQPQNPARDLFVNFNGDNMGYVPATYDALRRAAALH